MNEPSKRQLTIANMRLQTDLARAEKQIREQSDEIAKLKRDADTVRHAAQCLARLAS